MFALRTSLWLTRVLPELQNPREAARCLFIVDRFIKGGTSPRAVFEALGLGSTYIDAVEKLYNPDQPRVPAGNGRASGEWTSDDAGTGETTATGDGTGGDGAQGSSVVGRMSPTTASFLGELDVAEVAKLGIYASRILGPVGAAAAAFGLLFIPSPDDVHVGGDVAAIRVCTTPGIVTRPYFISHTTRAAGHSAPSRYR